MSVRLRGRSAQAAPVLHAPTAEPMLDVNSQIAE